MVDMQQRHFEFIAGVLRESRTPIFIKWGLILDFANALEETNPNFDRERFLAACRGED